ncbi:hypothetical protein A4E84_13155 [Streptomyces qaidamensis]|uniref:Uncharacterized protein n=1 Tax=Streptomyces qaidamensis TaxID=1783515 RepID=A0A143BZV8_9ACTN|nr:hypothetical protein A4E84_13155 [Streptomyces qaidamensis]
MSEVMAAAVAARPTAPSVTRAVRTTPEASPARAGETTCWVATPTKVQPRPSPSAHQVTTGRQNHQDQAGPGSPRERRW